MRVNTINLQIVRNLGNYETLRVGAEWTPDGNQSLTDALLQAQEELTAATAEVLAKRNVPAALAPAPAPAPAAKTDDAERKAAEQAAAEQAAKEAAAKQAEKEAAEKAAAKEKARQELAEKAAKDGKEVLTFESPKLQACVKRIESGVKLETVLNYFVPDEEAMKCLELAAKLNDK